MAYKDVLKAEMRCAEQNHFLEMNEFCMKRKIKNGVSPSFVWKSEHIKNTVCMVASVKKIVKDPDPAVRAAWDCLHFPDYSGNINNDS